MKIPNTRPRPSAAGVRRRCQGIDGSVISSTTVVGSVISSVVSLVVATSCVVGIDTVFLY